MAWCYCITDRADSPAGIRFVCLPATDGRSIGVTTPRIVSTEELSTRGTTALLDTRLLEDFEAGHVPGGVSNCVFEVAFLERMTALAPDTSKPVIVYGAGPESHEARMAAEKLIRAGYTDVSEFRGGMEEWMASRRSIEGDGGTPASIAPLIGRFEIDLAESRLEWLGRNLLNKHWGTVAIRSGFLEFGGGQVTGGEFVIDLTRIECSDLHGHDLHDVLIDHLHSDDFFDTANFPEATYRITSSEPVNDATPGMPNLRLHGDLTLKGVTSPLTLDAATGLTPEGIPAAQASFSLDRTQWNVIYGSARFFQRLAGHLVNDFIEFQARIVTRRCASRHEVL